MKSYRKELRFHTKTRRAYVNITPQVEAALSESGIREGLCLVNAMHITASVFINDNESGLHRDFERWLGQWGHIYTKMKKNSQLAMYIILKGSIGD